MNLKKPTEWTSQNRQELQIFLESATGQLTLEWVLSRTPKLLDGGDVNRALVASGRVMGYGESLSELISLTVEQPAEVKQVSETYPDLDDDTKWDDGKPKK